MRSGHRKLGRSAGAAVALALATSAGDGGMLKAAQAHGSLPISQQIMWRGDTMLVPAAYWGIFVGSDGGPWRWICEEAVNNLKTRQFVLLRDGTLYATDLTGLSVSRDGGCSWGPAAGDIAPLSVVGLAADPQLGRAWALANNADGSGQGLLSSDDAGRTWQHPYPMPSYLATGLAQSADGQRLAVGSVTQALPRQPVLHLSADGGKSFVAIPLSYQLDTAVPLTFFTPLWIDGPPQGSGTVYLQAKLDTGSAVLRYDSGSGVSEAMRTTGVTYGMTRAPSGSPILVATSKGIFAQSGAAPYSVLPTVSSAQCLSVHGGTLYGCDWNYAPDLAAIARLSADGQSYSKVFQFSDTLGPIDCPAGTSVAEVCPAVWSGYADQLGVDLKAPIVTPPPPTMSQGCSYQPSPARRGVAIGLGLVTALLLAIRRRRR